MDSIRNVLGINSTSTLSTDGPKFNSNTIKSVFDAVKLLGLDEVQQLCKCTVEKSWSGRKVDGYDLRQILMDKNIPFVHDEKGLYIQVNDKGINVNWLHQLTQEDLKKVQGVLAALSNNKKAILGAYVPGCNRDARVEVNGGYFEYPHIVVENGNLSIVDRGGFADDLTLLTRNELFVLFKNDLKGLNLTGYTFENLDFTKGDFTGTDFSRSTFINVDLTGAKQEGMIIKETSFENVKGFEFSPTTKLSEKPDEFMFYRTEINCDVKQYFAKQDVSLTETNLSFLLEHDEHRYLQFQAILRNTIPAKIQAASTSKLIFKGEAELKLLLNYFIGLNTTELSEFKQKYPDIYNQFFEIWLSYELSFDHTARRCLLTVEDKKMNERLATLYKQQRNQINDDQNLNEKGKALSKSTFELVTARQHPEKNSDVHKVIYSKLPSFKDQRNLSVTSRFNYNIYKEFWDVAIKLRPFGQIHRDYLATKVLSPLTTTYIENGGISVPDAMLVKRLADEDENYAPIAKYSRDGFLSDPEVGNAGEHLKQTFAHPLVQFLVNSGRLKKEQLGDVKPYHLEHLNQPYIRKWLTEDKLTVTDFLKLSADILDDLRDNAFFRYCVMNDQKSIEAFTKLSSHVRSQLKEPYLQKALQQHVLTLDEAIDVITFYGTHRNNLKECVEKYLYKGYSLEATIFLMLAKAKKYSCK